MNRDKCLISLFVLLACVANLPARKRQKQRILTCDTIELDNLCHLSVMIHFSHMPVKRMNMIECFVLYFILLVCLINWHVKKTRNTTHSSGDSCQQSMTHIVNESCRAWVMSRVIHVTRESCHTHVWVMSLTHTRDMTHSNDLCNVCLYEFCHWVVVHMSVNHCTHMHAPCHTCVSYMSHTWIKTNVSYLALFCLLVWSTGTPKKERHDWFITWFISIIHDTHI